MLICLFLSFSLVVLMYYPSRCTSTLQPLDAGDQILAMNLSDNEHEHDNAESDSSTQSDLEELLNN